MDVSSTVTIVNSKGLHARPCANFVKLANTFQSRIKVSHADKHVDGKSIMGMMMLAAAKGAEIFIQVEGDDATDALDALCDLINQGFHE